MDAKFSTSFIPKQTLSRSTQPYRSSSVNVLMLISVVVFIVILAVGAGVYMYHEKLKADLAEVDSEIADRKASFELGRVEEVKQFDRRVRAARDLLQKHVAFSQFFGLLEEHTIADVSFRDLSYVLDSGIITLKMEGVADGFAAIALQSDAFLARPELSNHSFFNFNLGDGGFVQFSYTAQLNPTAVSFGSLISTGVSTSTTP